MFFRRAGLQPSRHTAALQKIIALYEKRGFPAVRDMTGGERIVAPSFSLAFSLFIRGWRRDDFCLCNSAKCLSFLNLEF